MATPTISETLSSTLLPTQTPSALLPVNDEVFNCKLVGGFSIFVQLLVGTLGFSTLIIKRQFEKPRRPWLVWGFDVSKQVIGGSLMHMSNLLVSAISGGAKGESKTNPCSWYVLNLTLDCTLGVLILTGYLKVFGLLVRRYEIQGMESGDYGEPPQWKRWAKQASVFCMGMVFMKLTVVFLITVLPFLVNIGDMILKPVQLTHSPRFQIVFVMAIWPLTLNIFESWVIDQFIKTRRPHGHVPVADSATSFEMAGTAAPSGTVGETEHRFSIDMDGEFDFSDDDEDGTAAAGKFAGRSAKYTTVKSEDTLTMRDSFALDEEEHDLGLGKQHQD